MLEKVKAWVWLVGIFVGVPMLLGVAGRVLYELARLGWHIFP